VRFQPNPVAPLRQLGGRTQRRLVRRERFDCAQIERQIHPADKQNHPTQDRVIYGLTASVGSMMTASGNASARRAGRVLHSYLHACRKGL
jgi:hypothetical protein